MLGAPHRSSGQKGEACQIEPNESAAEDIGFYCLYNSVSVLHYTLFSFVKDFFITVLSFFCVFPTS